MTPPDGALRLAAKGKPVFPCNAEKKPTTPHGFKDASCDTAEITRLWRLHPGPLVGMPTGDASGIDVLDNDPRHGGDDWVSKFACHLPGTLTIQTRSGGTHFYFRHRPGMRNSESRIAPGIDVRGTGGYVITWAICGGFIVQRAPIADWPDWLAELALPPPPKPSPVATATPFPRAANNNRETDIAWNLIERSLLSVRTAPEGQRHYRLRAAARTIGGLIDRAGVSLSEAEQVLLRAVEAAGAANLAGAAKTVGWGLENGRSAPLVIGGRS